MIQTTPPGYHHRHTILHTSNHSSYDDKNHTSRSSPLPHHTANIKPQLLQWYKPHQLVITTATLYCTHQTTVLRDDKNHTTWSSPPPHNTTLKGCQPVSDSFSNVLISLPHQPAWEAFEEIEPSASVVQTAPHDPSSLFCKVLWHCPQSAVHTWNR